MIMMSSRRVALRPRRFIFTLLFITVAIAYCAFADEAVPVEEEEVVEEAEEEVVPARVSSGGKFEKVVVDDYLASLSTQALEKICLDRGFGLQARGEDGEEPPTREDYVEAARRCITLEDEINMILAEHPELAAELEAEVERMREQKERLEEERNTLLAEKELLETQLAQAGVDLSSSSTYRTLTTDKAPANMTFTEVVHESLAQLVERVKQDVKMVWSVVRVVLEPFGPALKVAWLTAKPWVLKIRQYALQLLGKSKAIVKDKLKQAS